VSFFDEITNFVTNLSAIFERIDQLESDLHALTNNILAEINRIKKFKQNPKWNTRVINVPRAFDQTKTFVQDIAQEIHDAFFSLFSNLKALRQTRTGGLVKGEKGSAGVTSVLGLITELNNFVSEVDQSVLALSDFVDALAKIREEIESFDTLFLPQGNSRVQLHDASPRIRVGSLHPQ
jgi:hypothetical protein